MRVAKGNASFVVVEMVHALIAAGKVGEVKRALGRTEVIAAVENSGRKGSKLLAEKLSAL